MNTNQLLRNSEVPNRIVDVVVDTDAYNEIDDQFAISYALLAPERLNVLALCAAPICQYDHHYSFDPTRHPIRYVYTVDRDALFTDLFEKLRRG